MRKISLVAMELAMVIGLIVAGGCSTAPSTTEGRQDLRANAEATVNRFKQVSPEAANRFLDSAAAYAVFPKVANGAFVVGGAFGQGVLYQNGNIAGYASMSIANIGAQIGGETYSEIIFFQNEKTLNDFKNGDFQFAASAKATAANASAAAVANYDHGVAVFTFNGQGLMASAAIGGQKFSFQPLGQVNNESNNNANMNNNQQMNNNSGWNNSNNQMNNNTGSMNNNNANTNDNRTNNGNMTDNSTNNTNDNTNGTTGR